MSAVAGSGPSFSLRFAAGLLLGALLTSGLLWTMQVLIASGDRTLNETERGHLVDFVRIKREETVERKKPKPRKPPPPVTPPQPPELPQPSETKPVAGGIAIPPIAVDTEINLSGGFNLGIGEGDYLPIVKVAPIYPRRALSRGVEGHCTVEYTVTRLGTVKDVRVDESDCTSTLFHAASVKAAARFKYKPRVVDGIAIEVPGVRNRFIYQLEK